MKAGALDRRVELRHRVLTRSATTGEETASYVAYATVWAERRDLSAREFFAAQTVNAETTTMFRIYYRDDVRTTDVIACDGAEFEITGIAQIGRRHGLELRTTTVPL